MRSSCHRHFAFFLDVFVSCSFPISVVSGSANDLSRVIEFARPNREDKFTKVRVIRQATIISVNSIASTLGLIKKFRTLMKFERRQKSRKMKTKTETKFRSFTGSQQKKLNRCPRSCSSGGFFLPIDFDGKDNKISANAHFSVDVALFPSQKSLLFPRYNKNSVLLMPMFY